MSNAVFVHYRTTPMPDCRTCKKRMDYWIPGLADKEHEHARCAGRRIAQECLDRVFGPSGTTHTGRDQESSPSPEGEESK